MSRGPGVLDQSVDIGGSLAQLDTLDISQEPLGLGRPVAGQLGASASVSAFIGGVVTMTGLTGVTGDSLGRCITVSGSSTLGNNGTFNITAVFGGATINYENASAVAPDANNGSISWVEREPYSLEDDINYARTNFRLIKGTVSWYDSVPTYVRPTDTLTDVDTNLTNVASNTLDAHAWMEPRYQESVAVSSGLTFVTITDVGNLKHANSVDLTGVPISDGYDAGNDPILFVEIVDAELDGYGDGANLRVLTGGNVGERIFGKTRAGAATSPNSVEIEFFSTPVDDWSFASESSYIWEPDQPTLVNVCYGYRQRLDLFDENAIRSVLIKGALSDTSGSGGSGGSGISEATHKALRHLIHFIDSGPADGFASGAFHEILPSGNPFPTSYIWWESASQIDKIVELTVTRGAGQKPITETWVMYDTDGSTALTTVTDTISYSGPFPVSRTRAIA